MNKSFSASLQSKLYYWFTWWLTKPVAFTVERFTGDWLAYLPILPISRETPIFIAHSQGVTILLTTLYIVCCTVALSSSEKWRGEKEYLNKYSDTLEKSIHISYVKFCEICQIDFVVNHKAQHVDPRRQADKLRDTDSLMDRVKKGHWKNEKVMNVTLCWRAN